MRFMSEPTEDGRIKLRRFKNDGLLIETEELGPIIYTVVKARACHRLWRGNPTAFGFTSAEIREFATAIDLANEVIANM